MSDMDILHPRRYPQHEGEKGQVHGGTCNRSTCNQSRAVFWNSSTFAFYCPACAKAINSNGVLCVKVDAKPTLDSMATA